MIILPQHIEAVRDGEGIGLAIATVNGRGETEYLCELDTMRVRPLAISQQCYLVMNYEL